MLGWKGKYITYWNTIINARVVKYSSPALFLNLHRVTRIMFFGFVFHSIQVWALYIVTNSLDSHWPTYYPKNCTPPSLFEKMLDLAILAPFWLKNEFWSVEAIDVNFLYDFVVNDCLKQRSQNVKLRLEWNKK